VHVGDEAIDDRLRIDPRKLRPIGRMGGLTFCRCGDRFSLPRGVAALRSDEV
jgi:hypothetical protein